MTVEIQRSLQTWHTYFRKNSRARQNIPWEAEDPLSTEEMEVIGSSIAAFQLGEYSEGKGLLKQAEDYSKHLGSKTLFEITRLFIKEEQNHALLLKRFMLSHNIGLLRKHWTDTVFRNLRKFFSYELSVTVLITAEIIALVYYRALQQCTSSQVLKSICDKILTDETFHVRYESELLLYLGGLKPWAMKRMLSSGHRFLFLGTILVVYVDHRKVLNRGGYDLIRFWKSCWVEFSNCFARKDSSADRLLKRSMSR